MHIVLLDDNTQRIEMTGAILAGSGYTCQACQNLKNELDELAQKGFDLLIVEQKMADILTAAWVRKNMPMNLPILLIAGSSEPDHIVQLLSSGVSDYLVKPIRRNELLARVEILLQRAYPDRNIKKHIQFGQYIFEIQKSRMTKDGIEITLTQKEFELALLLFQHLGRALSRVYIQDKIWTLEKEVPSRTIDTHVSRVRTKLQLRPENGFRLQPVYSYGYQLEEISS